MVGASHISVHKGHCSWKTRQAQQEAGYGVGKALGEGLVEPWAPSAPPNRNTRSSARISCSSAFTTRLLTYIRPASVFASPAL